MVTKEVFTQRLILAIFIALAVALGLAFQTNVDPAQALFQSPLPPMNDNFDSATVIGALPFSETQDISGATTESDEPQPCNFSERTVWYAFTPEADIVVRADTAGSNFSDTQLTVYESVGSGFVGLNFLNCASFSSPVIFLARAGTTYYVQAGGLFGSSGGLQVNLEEVPPPSNDDFTNATSFTDLPFSDSVDAAAATIEPDEPAPSCVFFGDLTGTIWYAFTPPTSGSVTARVGSFSTSTMVAAYTGNSLGDLSEVGCRSFGDVLAFLATEGTTYYFQVGSLFGRGDLQFSLEVPPPPEAQFSFDPFDPSVFDTIQFFDNSFDPGGVGIETQAWDFGDGATATGCCPTHRYAADGDYTVQLMVTTFDGRSASTSQVVQVRTHDVAITKFSAPKAASAGQTRNIVVGLNSKQQPEEVVEVQLYKSVPGGFEFVGSLIQTVPARSANRTTNFDFSYTFTAADASIGKVTFKAVAFILNANDALPADNEAIAAPTKVNR